MPPRARRPDPLESTLAGLRALRDDPSGPEAKLALARALADRSAHAVAAAGKIVATHDLAELEPDLVRAFVRFLDAPGHDPGCTAKSALAEALVRVGCEHGDLLVRGARHVQLEPVWGKRVDTAAAMRGVCCIALVRCGSEAAYLVAAELLADPETPARAGAAEALGYGAPVVAAPLLRFKAAAGDPEPRVLGECFASLLRVDPDGSLAFVARRLECASAEVAELAALALGESQAPGAFAVLRGWFEGASSRDTRRIALVAIAFLRSDESLAFLLGLVADAALAAARHAIEALGVHRGRADVRERALAAVARRGHAELEEALRTAFGG